MPTCLASGCPNTTGKTKVKKSYYRVPRPNSDFERERAYRWLLNLQISQKFDFTKDKVVCEDHFHIDSYMSHVHVPPSSQDLRPRKRLLKEGTLPTIFPDCVYDVINMNGTKASGDPRTTLADYFASRNHGMVRIVFSFFLCLYSSMITFTDFIGGCRRRGATRIF